MQYQKLSFSRQTARIVVFTALIAGLSGMWITVHGWLTDKTLVMGIFTFYSHN